MSVRFFVVGRKMRSQLQDMLAVRNTKLHDIVLTILFLNAHEVYEIISMQNLGYLTVLY